MFRKMRLEVLELPREKAEELFTRVSHSTLAVIGDDGYPYSVPVSQVYRNGKIYFHGAKAGHKFDAMQKCDKASMSVVGRDDVQPDKFATYYESGIAFGRVKVVEDDKERWNIIEWILEKYSPGYIKEGLAYAEKEWDNVAVFELSIEHMTAKSLSKVPL